VMVGLLLVITHQVRRPAAAVAAMPMASLEADTTELIDVSPLQQAAPARVSTASAPAPVGADEPTGPLPAVSDDTAPINAAPSDTADKTSEVPRATYPWEES
ncbi:MAG: hypothetical protein LWW77_12765, partial [Propionibacteriales bacterium]|nr:hypothetical protein [Propionibacteriales bacterium]